MRCYVLMGVSGCGKSSVGTALKSIRDVEFVDGDELHPLSNINKMSGGMQLNDEDRAPWLAEVGRRLAQHDGAIAIGCSALKKKYRDWIREEVNEPLHFLHLNAPKDVMQRRASRRCDHFMPVSLLDSQYDTFERLQDDEWGREINIDRSFPEVTAQSEDYVRSTMI